MQDRGVLARQKPGKVDDDNEAVLTAHHACNVNKKGALLSVSLIDLLLTIASAALAATLYARFRSADEVQPENGRRLFMAKLGLLLSGLCALIILGGLCATLLISPCD